MFVVVAKVLTAALGWDSKSFVKPVLCPFSLFESNMFLFSSRARALFHFD